MQMVNAIPGRNLPVLNFAYHLTKPWTDQFVHANGKQEFCTNRRDGRQLLMVCYLSIWGLSLTHTDDHILVTHSHGRSHSTYLIWVSNVNQKGLLRARQKYIPLCMGQENDSASNLHMSCSTSYRVWPLNLASICTAPPWSETSVRKY